MYLLYNMKLSLTFLILKISAFCLLALVFVQFTVDDAYISFRYAHNLINYGIWNYNPNSRELVEAYTNPAYTVLNIIPEIFNISPALFFKLVGLALLSLLFFIVERRASSRLVGLILIINPAFYVHGLAGLETVFFVFVTFIALSELMKTSLTTKNYIVLTVLGILLPLIRPEGALFALIIAGVFLLKQKFRFLVILVGCWLLYYASRFTYFDALLPNTFYIKSSGTLNYLQILSNYKVMALDFLIVGLIFCINSNLIVRISCTFGVLTLNYYCFSDLQMNYVHRFGFQITMIMILLHMSSTKFSWKYWSNKLMFCLLVTYSALMFKYSYVLVHQQYSNNIVTLQNIGCELRSINQNGVMVMGDAGTLPYWSNWEVIDSIGLASREIGKLGALSEDYLVEKDPSLILLYDFYDTTADDFKNLAGFNNQAVVQYLENNIQNFQYAGRFYWMDDYSYLFYVNKTHETKLGLTEALKPYFEDSLQNLSSNGSVLASILRMSHFKDELNATNCKQN